MSSALNEVVPCVVSGIPIEDLLALVEPACDEAATLSWDHNRRLTLSSVVVAISSGSLLGIESRSSAPRGAGPASAYLRRENVGSADQSPLDLLLCKRGVRTAVYAAWAVG